MATLDIHINQGADKRVPLAFLDDYCEVDLTGCTARMEIRPSPASEKVLDLLTSENGRLTIDSRTLTLFWPHEITEALPVGTWVYDLELVTANGEVTRVLAGRIFVSREVTKWPTQATEV